MSNDVKKDNPAGRLFHILTYLMAESQKERQFREVIASKYTLEKGDLIGITIVHLALLNLIKETRETVYRLGLSEMFTQPIDNLQANFSSIGLNHSWSSYVEFLDPSVLISLKFISDRLSSSTLGAPPVPEQQVNDLIDQIDELIQEVNTGEMDYPLKYSLLERLEGIRRSLQEYLLGFRGNEVFSDEFSHTLGYLILHQNEIRNLGGKDKSQTLKDKMKKLLVELEKIVATVAVKELVSTGIKKLPELVEFIDKITN